jgi:hypothetical protein
MTVTLCDGPKGWTPAVRADIECGVRDRKLESTARSQESQGSLSILVSRKGILAYIIPVS